MYSYLRSFNGFGDGAAEVLFDFSETGACYLAFFLELNIDVIVLVVVFAASCPFERLHPEQLLLIKVLLVFLDLLQ